MAHDIEKQHNFDFFAEKYSRNRSDTTIEVERTVLGHECGLNGYTTVNQARILGDLLHLSHKSILLDVGGGYGWPGLYLAQNSNCRLVSTDIPLEALRLAKVNIKKHELESSADVLAADGRALPFRSESFDRIVHTDVFC